MAEKCKYFICSLKTSRLPCRCGKPAQSEGGDWLGGDVTHVERFGAVEGHHGHVGSDGWRQSEGWGGFGGKVGHVEALGALEVVHGHVGGDGGPQGEGGPQI